MDVTGEMQPGRLFARDFRVERLLASGGMGAVYVVEQVSTGKRRALKVLFPQFVKDEDGRRRFAQEARVGADIDSDHVVDVVGAGVDESTGTPWLAMELLEGEDLAAFVKSRGRLDVATVRAVMEQLCDALARAHAKGVVHRDLKPENLFIAVPKRRGVPFTLKVLDFGIAKIIQENRAAATGSVTIGSPLWMAPEQAMTAAPISPRTDVWAIGLIAYWLLTGTPYWNSARGAAFNLPALLVETMTAPIEPASARAASVSAHAALPAGFDAWFARCVAREPAARFADAGAANDALAPLLGYAAPAHGTVPIAATPAPPVEAAVSRTEVVPQIEARVSVAPAPHRGSGHAMLLGGGLAALASAAVGGWLLLREPAAAGGRREADASIGGSAMTDAAAPNTPRPVDMTTAPPPPAREDVVRERVIRGTASVGAQGDEGSEGEIDARDVASRIRARVGAIRGCYERALRERPNLAGRIEVRFTIGADGRVTSIRPEGLPEAPEVGACVANVIRRIEFPRPTGGAVEFSFPFTFSPGG